MVSLGEEVYAGKLRIRDSLTVDGSVRASHKILGDAKNQGELHHQGSFFYIKWSAVHQVSSLETTDTSSTVHVTTTAEHGLVQNDAVHISSLPLNPGIPSELNGIPVSELSGTHIVTALPSATTFSIGLTTLANSSGTSSNLLPQIRVDRYKYTDMNSSDATWNFSTTLPSPSHTNAELFYW